MLSWILGGLLVACLFLLCGVLMGLIWTIEDVWDREDIIHSYWVHTGMFEYQQLTTEQKAVVDRIVLAQASVAELDE